jgi:D-aminopeptidase
VLRAGEVVERRAWGFANAERRIPFTPATLFRVCSITKQFVCALLLDLHPDPSILDADLAARLPNLDGAAPGALHLAHNQSGLRDYWALAMLHGASAESSFGEEEARRVIGGARALQFAPGTRYSYCNSNFRLLGDAIAARAGRSLAELLRERVFAPAGMETAFLAADTRALPDGTEGYEGTQATGFRPAVNRILWTGDAGMGASLDDMIAWERFIDATRDDRASLYRRLSVPVRFADGARARYGFGLGRSTEQGRAVTGHGGALRGWRSHRLHVAAERLSVVVMFNHLSDARAAASEVLAEALGGASARPGPPQAAPDWLGSYLDPETELAVRVAAGAAGRVELRFVRAPETLELRADGSALGGDGTRLRFAGGALWMDRPGDNLSTPLERLGTGPGAGGLDGRYRCAELDTELTVVDAGGVVYGGFSGRLGPGRMESLDRIGPDVLALPCPRALDHSPPGDWTLLFGRDHAGRVTNVTVGCWLARGLRYERVG